MTKRITSLRPIPYIRADVEELSRSRSEPAWLLERRLRAWEIFESLPMPGPKDESWRRTDYRAIKWDAVAHLVPGRQAPTGLPESDSDGGLIVQSGAETVRAQLAEELAAKGVIFTDLTTALAEHGGLLREHLMTRAVLPENGKFAALHGALWTHGILLYVPRGVDVTLPLHSIWWAGEPGTIMGHVLIVLDENASVSYIHETASPTLQEQALSVGATEIILGPNSSLRYVQIQNWGRHTFEFGHNHALLTRDAHLEWVINSIGSRLSKSFVRVELEGEGASATVSGIYFASDGQLLDHDTRQNHKAPRTTSNLLFKGAVKGTGRSVWQGMIHVHPGAQKIDGFQESRTLLLSEGAHADNIPGLEIEADDVKCSHAATVGRLEEEPIYYLMTRGVPRAEAERLIIEGFFAQVMDRIPFASVRERLGEEIAGRLNGSG